MFPFDDVIMQQLSTKVTMNGFQILQYIALGIDKCIFILIKDHFETSQNG